MTSAHTNPIGFLQEFVQKHNVAPFPKYIETGVMGPDHSRKFTFKCIYDGYEVVASARQKKQAKSEAAMNMIELLKEEKYFEKRGLSLANGFCRAIGKFDSPPQNSVTDVDASLPTAKNPISALHEEHGLSLASGFCGAIDKFDSPPQNSVTDVDASLPSTKNPISALQEYCLEKKLEFPVYYDTSTPGGFVCECILKDRKSYGNGITKKAAKTESAAKMCNQLNISYSGEMLVKKETKSGELEFESNKNPISALQELCQRNHSKFPIPVYGNKDMFMNQFVITCTVGKVTKNGMSTTKKAAKIIAANNVLSELIKSGQTNYNKGNTTPKQPAAVTKGTDSTDSFEPLEEFNLGDDEDDVNSSVNQPTAEQLTKTMESLNLDDTVVEVEPTRRIFLHSNVRLLTSGDAQETLTKTKNDRDDTHLHTVKTPTSESLLKWAKKTELR